MKKITSLALLFLFALGSVYAQGTDPEGFEGKRKNVKASAADPSYLPRGTHHADKEDAILELLQEEFPALNLERVLISSTRYIVEADSEGDPVSRSYKVQALTGEPEGKCRAYAFLVKQPFIAADYGMWELVETLYYYDFHCDDYYSYNIIKR